MPETPRNADELGALWVNTGAKGEYLSGTIQGVRVVCFKNDKKVAGDTLPTWRVLKAKAPGEPRRDAPSMTSGFEDDVPPF